MPYKDPLKRLENNRLFRATHPNYERRYDRVVRCSCGCGEEVTVTRHSKRGFKKGHWANIQGVGKSNHNWRGGITNHVDGYKVIRLATNTTKLQHRVIFEEYYKCCLLEHADVHHIDGNKSNNNIENLMGMMHDDHAELRRNPITGRFI